MWKTRGFEGAPCRLPLFVTEPTLGCSRGAVAHGAHRRQRASCAARRRMVTPAGTPHRDRSSDPAGRPSGSRGPGSSEGGETTRRPRARRRPSRSDPDCCSRVRPQHRGPLFLRGGVGSIRIGSRRRDACEKALGSEGGVRYAAAQGISLFGEVGFLALVRIAEHGDSTARVAALVAMGDFAKDPANAALHSDPETLEMIFGLVSQPRQKVDVELGACILRGLRVDPLRAVPLLRDALVRTPDYGIAAFEIVAALQAYGAGPEPTPPRTAASLTVAEYRRWASPQLGERGPRSESIRTRLRSSDEYVVRGALADLRAVGPEDTFWCPEFADVLSSRSGGYAVEPLCAIGAGCIPYLLPHLTGADPRAALWAFQVLEKLEADGPEVTPAVLTALSSTRPEVQCAALRALARVSPRDAQAAILERAGHETLPFVRREALLLVPVAFAEQSRGWRCWRGRSGAQVATRAWQPSMLVGSTAPRPLSWCRSSLALPRTSSPPPQPWRHWLGSGMHGERSFPR